MTDHHRHHRLATPAHVHLLPGEDRYSDAETTAFSTTFLAFTKDLWSGDDPTPDFLEAARSLQKPGGGCFTLSPWFDFGRLPGLFEQRVVVGFYNGTSSQTRNYGFVEIMLLPSTSTTIGYGLSIRFNDGRVYSLSDWVRVKWLDGGDDLYVHFAAGNDGGNAVLALRFGPGTGDADYFEVNLSH